MPMHLFLRHNAVLARYMLSSCVCLSVRTVLSVTIRYCIETTGRIELFFGNDVSFKFFSPVPTLCYKKVRESSKMWKYAPKLST